jgi:hypothetical protein
MKRKEKTRCATQSLLAHLTPLWNYCPFMTYENVLVGVRIVTRRPIADVSEGALGLITKVRPDPWGFMVLWDYNFHRQGHPRTDWLGHAELIAFEPVTDDEAEVIRIHYFAERYGRRPSPQLILPFDLTWSGPQPGRRPGSNPLLFGGGRW